MNLNLNEKRTNETTNAREEIRILVVDDDKLFRTMMIEKLLSEGFIVTEADDGKEAMDILKVSRQDMIITDLIMPNMDGFEFIRWVREKFTDIPVIVVSGRGDFESIHSIISYWVYEYLVKPINLNDLAWTVRGAGEKIRNNRREDNYIRSLERQVEVQMEKNRRLFYEAVQSLVNALEAKDRYTQGHSLRVSYLATLLAKELNLSDEETVQVSLAGQLHDIGKLAISDDILNKKGKLTDDEYSIIKQHPLASHKILQPILHDNSLEAVLHHHERWDGEGYPKKIAKSEIPLTARIISLADAFDAMTSERAYRTNMSKNDACQVIEHNSGSQFDPEIAPIFNSFVNEV